MDGRTLDAERQIRDSMVPMKPRNLGILTGVLWTGCLLFGLVQTGWTGTTAGLFPPAAAFAAAGLLAAVFGQTATLCLALLAGTLTGLLQFAAFLQPNESAAAAVVLAASLYLPASALLLETAPEVPALSGRGIARMLFTLSAILVCLLLYAIISVTTPTDPVLSLIHI